MLNYHLKRTILCLNRFFKVSVQVSRYQYSKLDMTSVRPVVMSGPSGGGKSTLLNRLMTEFPDSFAFSVSHTTRGPRPGETNGKDYHFVNVEEFIRMVENREFLEHAQFSGNKYGTSKAAVEAVQKTGRICILDVEVNGVKNIKQTDLNARYIFVKPPNMDILVKRLNSRGTETEESLQKRIASAKEAMDYAEQPGSYDHIVINDDLDEAYKCFKGLLLEDINYLKQEGSKVKE